MPKRGGPAAQRGFRLQTLFGLYQLLSAGADAEFFLKLEGTEDIDINTASDDTIAFIQVKAFNEPLQLSHLEPGLSGGSSDSNTFFARTLQRLAKGSGARHNLVSFGPIGPELANAWDHEGAERESIRLKLAARYRPEQIERLFESVELEPVDEGTIRSGILNILGSSVAGGEPERAIAILAYWLQCTAERDQWLTPADTAHEMAAVGRFLADRATFHREWFTSINPVESKPPSGERRARLGEEFFQGIGARFEHIAARIDVPRTRLLDKLWRLFNETNVLIVHGASGQGKSALAYRFLNDFIPAELRFEVRSVQDLRHAQSISAALIGHGRTLGVPLVVYVDVQPRDRNWTEVVERLARVEQIRVLVTIREEDWTAATGFESRVDFREVALDFDKSEARMLFDRLRERDLPVEVLCFEDAWSRFNGDGPLLEFVYLVTQNQRLRARLESQVRALEDELPPEAINFLRVVAVASAYGARLRLQGTAAMTALPKPIATVHRLEREYLIRSSEDGRLIEGLHPIRSAFLSELLTDPVLAPWADAALLAIETMIEDDLETFLLHGFSRHQKDAQELIAALHNLTIDTWQGARGVLRALLWYGIRLYVDENQGLFDDAWSRFGDGWSVLLLWDVIGLKKYFPDLFEVNWDFLPDLASDLDSLKARRTREAAECRDAKHWLRRLDNWSRRPSSAHDWACIAEVAFWTGYWGIENETAWLGPLDLSSALETLTIEDFADVFFGISWLHCQKAQQHLESVQQQSLRRYRRETSALFIEDDGTAARTHFILDPRQWSIDQARDGNDIPDDALNGESMRRVELLQKLLPMRDRYGCQGYGHRSDSLKLPYDPTSKDGIPRKHLPPTWAIRINVVFVNLIDNEYRPVDWQYYAKTLIRIRENIVSSLEDARQAIIQFFKNPKVRAPFARMNTARWDRTRLSLSRVPMLPMSAVDEWGFASETRGREPGAPPRPLALHRPSFALIRTEGFRAALRAVARPLGNFFTQAVHALALHPLVEEAPKRRSASVRKQLQDAGYDPHFIRLSLHNLTDATKNYQQFQWEFQNQLGGFCDARHLDDLERREQRVFDRFWLLWQEYVSRPSQRPRDAELSAEQRIFKLLGHQAQELVLGFDKLKRAGVNARFSLDHATWEGSPTLCVVFDLEEPCEVWSVRESLLEIGRRAFHAGTDSFTAFTNELVNRTLALVPLSRGRSFDMKAWAIPTIVFNGDVSPSEAEPWSLMPRPIPDDLQRALRIERWEGNKLTKIAEQMQLEFSRLFACLRHYLDVCSLIEGNDADGVDEEVREAYEQAQTELVSTNGEKFSAAMADFLSICGELADTELEVRPSLVQAVQIFVKVVEVISDSGPMGDDDQVEIEYLRDRVAQLEGLASQFELLKLLVFGDYLSYIGIHATERPGTDSGAGGRG